MDSISPALDNIVPVKAAHVQDAAPNKIAPTTAVLITDDLSGAGVAPPSSVTADHDAGSDADTRSVYSSASHGTTKMSNADIRAHIHQHTRKMFKMVVIAAAVTCLVIWFFGHVGPEVYRGTQEPEVPHCAWPIDYTGLYNKTLKNGLPYGTATEFTHPWLVRRDSGYVFRDVRMVYNIMERAVRYPDCEHRMLGCQRSVVNSWEACVEAPIITWRQPGTNQVITILQPMIQPYAGSIRSNYTVDRIVGHTGRREVFEYDIYHVINLYGLEARTLTTVYFERISGASAISLQIAAGLASVQKIHVD